MFGYVRQKLREGLVLWQMCCCEMAIRVQGNSRRTGGIVHQGTIEEDFTRWWCHLAAVCVFCCLDLFWGGHGASGDGGFPGFCGVVDAIQSCGAEKCFGRAAWQV